MIAARDRSRSEQISLLEEARDALTGEHGALTALVTARLSVASSLVIPEPQRLELATEAVRLAQSAGDDAVLAALCDAIAGPGHCAERRDCATEIIDICQATVDNVSAGSLLPAEGRRGRTPPYGLRPATKSVRVTGWQLFVAGIWYSRTQVSKSMPLPTVRTFEVVRCSS